jgi:hypothetical protein
MPRARPPRTADPFNAGMVNAASFGTFATGMAAAVPGSPANPLLAYDVSAARGVPGLGPLPGPRDEVRTVFLSGLPHDVKERWVPAAAVGRQGRGRWGGRRGHEGGRGLGPPAPIEPPRDPSSSP